MKYTKLFAGVALLALTACANAEDILTTQTLTFDNLDGVLNADIGHVFGASDTGKTFLDVYSFSITAADVAAGFSSFATFKNSVATSDLSFSSFNLYSGTGSQLLSGDYTSLSNGVDIGALESNLASGTYTLAIAGTVLGTSGGKYTGSVTVSPVPEPETWALTLSGLAAVGFLARRRKARGALPA